MVSPPGRMGKKTSRAPVLPGFPAEPTLVLDASLRARPMNMWEDPIAKCVLVIDDEPEIQRAVRAALRGTAESVLTANTIAGGSGRSRTSR